LVAASYRSSFFFDVSSPLLATARAGNVIGGGDWSDDRLIPDLVRAIHHNKVLKVRSPNAIRPWQHVLEALCGYLLLGQSLLEGKRDFAGPWNFGPKSTDNCSVSEVINHLNVFWPELASCTKHDSNLHETTSLYLDSAKARNLLNWETIWDMDQALEKTANWYRSWMYDQKIISQMQLVDYIASAQQRKVSWVN
jgi:CDP-glucose 4,6-dehydratase